MCFALGPIPTLRQHILGLFLIQSPTHYVSINIVLNAGKNEHFPTPPTQSFCWRNIGMVPLCNSEYRVSEARTNTQFTHQYACLQQTRVFNLLKPNWYKQQQFIATIIFIFMFIYFYGPYIRRAWQCSGLLISWLSLKCEVGCGKILLLELIRLYPITIE